MYSALVITTSLWWQRTPTSDSAINSAFSVGLPSIVGGADQINEEDIARASKTSQTVNRAREKGGKTGAENRFADVRGSGFAKRYNRLVVYVNQGDRSKGKYRYRGIDAVGFSSIPMITRNSVGVDLGSRDVILSRAVGMVKKEVKIVSNAGIFENVVICSRVKWLEG